jgi:hypothetical protein
LSRVGRFGDEVECILEYAARYMETLQSAFHTDLKDDAVTIVWHRCPNERIATHGAPVKHVL